MVFSGQFLLTNLLLETMNKTAQKTRTEGRIINVSSDMHRYSVHKEGIRFETINDEKRCEMQVEVHYTVKNLFFDKQAILIRTI